MTSESYKGWLLGAIILISVLVPRSLCFVPFIPGLIGYVILSWKARVPLPIDRWVAGFFTAAIALCLLSTIWSIDPAETLERTANTAGLFFFGLLLLAVCINQTLKAGAGLYALLAGYMLIGLYIFVEYRSGMAFVSGLVGKHVDIWNYNRSLVVYVLLFLPLATLAGKIIQSRTRFILTITVMAICAGLPVWYTSSQTAQIIFIMALGSYGLLRLVPFPQARQILLGFSGIFLCAMILASPFIPGPLTKILETHADEYAFSRDANAMGRLEIWNFVAEQIAQKPLLGHGVESMRTLESPVVLPVNKTDSFLHPHNAYLQIWVETGLAGAVLTCFFAIFLLWRISKSNAQDQPLYFSLYAALATGLATGYGLWQSWQLGLLLALAALSLLLTKLQKA